MMGFSHVSQTDTSAKTIKIDSLRFSDKDLVAIGTLDHGQFGVVRITLHDFHHILIELVFQIDVVNCTFDGRVYVRKSIEKTFALRTREVNLRVLFVCHD